MSLLQTLMSQALPSSSKGISEEDKIAKEGRTAYRKLMEAAVKEGNQKQIAALAKNAPEGVDASLYTSIAGMRTPEQQAKAAFDIEMANQIQTLIGGGTPTPTQTPQQVPPGQPVQTQTQATPQTTTDAPTEEPVATSTAPPLITRDFVKRAALKKFSGIDPGANYFQTPAWFQTFGEKVNAGTPVSQAVHETAVQYNFIPDGASSLKGLDEGEREVLFEREFSRSFNDPILIDVINKAHPKMKDNGQTRAGYILEAMAAKDGFIPDHYQPILDRFRDLEDKDFISDEMKTVIWETKGKPPNLIEPEDISDARVIMENRAINKMVKENVARFKTEQELEPLKQISAEDRAKHGIGASFQTYQDVADAGFRFATETDRKDYQDITDVMDLFDTVLEPLVLKVFSSSDDLASRIKHGAAIRSGEIAGTDLWLAARQYERQLSIIGKKMLSMVERGGRFTDQDYAKILNSLPMLNYLRPDGRKLARSMLDTARTLLGMKIEGFDSVLVKPTESTQTVKQTQDKFEKDKVYTDAQGRKAKYLGEGKWQLMKIK